ncbi:MMPL family transporter [Iamia majanohamensis]|uniref:MMPL family transporter n=1 Tax=Iamia majanohamensis TaxID=467976 RepID=A0AAF0BSS2_9ACTN|nr:MMPL family transporter [Iamia majanohamensis]WCO65707.1 MMPL family transporter [Iamia majanohamensis]
MKRFWSRLAVELGRRAGLVAAVGLILTGILGFGVTRLDFATSQDSYLNTDDQVYIDNVAYQDLFGGQAMLSVLVTEEGTDVADLMASTENQAVFADIADQIGGSGDTEGVPNVEAVVTPLTALQLSDTLIQRTPTGEAAADPTQSIAGGALAFAAGLGGEGPPELQEEAGTPEAEARTQDTLATAERLGAIPVEQRTFDNPDWIEFLLRDNQGEIRKALRPFFPDEETAQVVTRLGGNLDIEDEGAAAEAVTDIVDEATIGDDAPMEGLSASTTVGAPTLLSDINDYLKGGLLSLGAIAVGVMVIVLLLLFQVRWRLLPLAVILIGVTWAFGLAGYIGIPLSLVTISGLPVMLGVGIDYAIQMHARIEEEVIIDRVAHPIQESARKLGPALLVVTFDAVLAFVALKFARVPMIRDFGDLLIVGIIVICFTSIILPIALLGMREFRSPTKGRDFRSGALGKLTVFLGSLPKWTAVPFALISGLIFVGGVVVEGDIEIKADPIEWVNQDSETVQKIDAVQAQTGSSSDLGVYVQSDDVFEQSTVTYVHTLAGCALGSFPDEGDSPYTKANCQEDYIPEQFVEVDGEEQKALLTASSIVTTMSYILEIPGATPLPPRAADVQAAWEQAPPAIQAFTATEDGENLNLLFRTGYSSLSDGEEVVTAIRTDANPPEGTTAVPSGLAVVGVGLLENIESNRAQLTYYAIAFVGIFLMIRLRSLIRSVLSLVPVLIATGLASLVAFGLGLELSPMTAVGGPLVVAICTEFTSLILLRFVEERERGFAPQGAADVAAARTGRAFIVSALTGVVGVGVIATSSLPLLRDFGLIVALNVVVALLSALVILPPMLVWADQEGREWVSRRLVSEEDLARSRGGKGLDADVPEGGDPSGPGTDRTPAGQT